MPSKLSLPYDSRWLEHSWRSGSRWRRAGLFILSRNLPNARGLLAMSYLTRYAEPEAKLAAALVGGPWDEAIVVPVLRESELLAGLLDSLACAAREAERRVLAILVVNHRASASETDKADNRLVLNQYGGQNVVPGLSVSERGALTCAWIDKASPGRELEARDGVGTARKIGCDIAVALKEAGRLLSDYGSTTDGDARVGADYFTGGAIGRELGLGQKRTGFVHRFRHEVGDTPQDLPLTLYEIYLRHYVLGLKAAGSPYAFHTVGSLIRFELSAYAQTRGFPKREAGEDFYLLDKLAKLGRVAEHSGVVKLVPRPSDRVPFGTGAAMARVGSELRRGKVFQLFPDSAFRAVRAWQEALNELGPTDGAATWKSYLISKDVSPSAVESANQLGLFRMIEEAGLTRRDGGNFKRHLQTSFGALKTYQWIRGIAQTEGETEFREGLKRSEFLDFEVSASESALSLLGKIRRADEA